jgi:hypothetical protein
MTVIPVTKRENPGANTGVFFVYLPLSFSRLIRRCVICLKSSSGYFAFSAATLSRGLSFLMSSSLLRGSTGLLEVASVRLVDPTEKKTCSSALWFPVL